MDAAHTNVTYLERLNGAIKGAIQFQADALGGVMPSSTGSGCTC